MTITNDIEFALGRNTNVKKHGIVDSWSSEQVSEYAKCMKDPKYFARNYCKIISLDKGLINFELYPYQENMFEAFEKNRFNIILACRQSGKSISSVAYLLWYAIFQPDKNVAILANKAATAREMLSRITLMLENLPFFLQPGTKVLNKGSIEFSNNSRIFAAATTGQSIRGQSVSLLYLDEFAFVDNDVEFYTSTYPVVVAGSSTKIIVTSTANGVGNVFEDLWTGALQGTNDFKPSRVDWWDVPGRDEKWKIDTIKNTSQLQFDQEFGNCLKNNSEITILMNNSVAEITIGKLYECIKRGSSSGLSVDEEIRRASIRWYRDRETYEATEKQNKDFAANMKILTPTGFRSFDGVKRYWHDKYLKFIFEDDTTVECAVDHKFIVNNNIVYAHSLSVNDYIGKKIKEIVQINIGDYFYDPVNVDNGNVYNHDNVLVSHNTFLGTGDTLINGETLMKLRAIEPIKTLEKGDLKIYKEPEKKHQYLVLVDVAKGRGQDYSSFNIIDITNEPFEQVVTYRNNKISPILFPNVIEKYAKIFNEAYVIVEANDQGSLVTKGLYYDLEYENLHASSSIKADALGIEMNKKVKRIGCSSIKDIIESNKLRLYDKETIKECTTFVAKGQSYEASNGNHDDLMMNLVLFGYFSVTEMFEDMSNVNLKKMIFDGRIQEIENDMVPFGWINNGVEDAIKEEENKRSSFSFEVIDNPW